MEPFKNPFLFLLLVLFTQLCLTRAIPGFVIAFAQHAKFLLVLILCYFFGSGLGSCVNPGLLVS